MCYFPAWTFLSGNIGLIDPGWFSVSFFLYFFPASLVVRIGKEEEEEEEEEKKMSGCHSPRKMLRKPTTFGICSPLGCRLSSCLKNNSPPLSPLSFSSQRGSGGRDACSHDERED